MDKRQERDDLALIVDYAIRDWTVEESMAESIAAAVRANGYRKQVEGEWKRSERSKYDFFCTVCGEKAVRNIYGNHDRLFKFCPHCGAKMKGE